MRKVKLLDNSIAYIGNNFLIATCKKEKKKMDLEKIKELIEMLETSSLHKLKLKNGDEELILEKELTSQGAMFLTSPQQQGASISQFPNAEHVASPSSPSSNEEAKVEAPEISDYTSIAAPLVGIYYEASSPENPPFVKVGSQVKAGDTLCIIEAMKVLNEIKAPVAGEVKAIYAKNGDVISYDQVLIEIGE